VYIYSFVPIHFLLKKIGMKNTRRLFLILIVSALSINLHGQNKLRLPDGREAFLSGINVAWENFGGDVADEPINVAYWTNMLDEVRSLGGNSIRWWLYTNASQSPKFASGYVSEMGTQTVNNIRTVLDLAHDRNMVVILCLFSFDLLKSDQWGVNIDNNYRMLTTDAGIRACIDNSITPLVTEIGNHPAIACWEIFNEPEGMVSAVAGDWGNIPQHITMYDVQRFVNRAAGAIHRAVPGILVSNGSWNMKVLCDRLGHRNYYSDSELISAGGDSDGFLDFYMVHYYNNDGGDNTHHSPFHHNASYWGLDKPIIVAEFSAHGFDNPYLTPQDTYQRVFDNQYAGVLTWKYNQGPGNNDGHGNLSDATPGFEYLRDNHLSDITFGQGPNPDPDPISEDCPQLINTLVNPLATTETVELKHYLDSVYHNSNNRISGQMNDNHRQYILDVTGKEPAMMGYDFDGMSPSQTYKDNIDAQKATAWYNERGGIVQFSWHWICPDETGSYYVRNNTWPNGSTFNLRNALDNPQGQSYSNMIRDMDIVAGELRKLQDAGVPVLWRPLHEAEGQWFWWGNSGGAALIELYRLMYDRYTNHHGLNNLIWVWTSYGDSRGGRNWYPGDDVVDMIVWDYPAELAGNDAWQIYQRLFGNSGKLFAIGEEGRIADPATFDSQSWLYFLTWDYMVFDPADNNRGSNPRAWLREMYNHERIITLDELPDWKNYNSCVPIRQNLALNKPVTVSSTEVGANIATNINDGNRSTRWSSIYTDNQWVEIDLQGSYFISNAVLIWEAAYANSYTLQVSNDGSTWTTVHERTNSSAGNHTINFTPTMASHVRVDMGQRATLYGFSLYEIEIYEHNLALDKPVAVSSTEVGVNLAANITDGNRSTRWSSAYSDPQGLVIDLQDIYNLSRLAIVWEDAYATSYSVSVSADSSNWATIKTTQTGTGGRDVIETSTNARYIRIEGYERATVFGYSIFEVEAYGSPIIELVQTIELAAGWNLVSIGLESNESMAVADIFGIPQVAEVKDMDTFWQHSLPAYLNSLSQIVPGRGYLVKADAPASIKLTGTLISTSSITVITDGWKLYGNSSLQPLAASQIQSQTGSQQIKDFDGFWILNSPSNSFEELAPGKACFIKF
jgi:hypothetical protein